MEDTESVINEAVLRRLNDADPSGLMVTLAAADMAEREQRRREAPLAARIAEKQKLWEGVFAELAPLIAGTLPPRC